MSKQYSNNDLITKIVINSAHGKNIFPFLIHILNRENFQ